MEIGGTAVISSFNAVFCNLPFNVPFFCLLITQPPAVIHVKSVSVWHLTFNMYRNVKITPNRQLCTHFVSLCDCFASVCCNFSRICLCSFYFFNLCVFLVSLVILNLFSCFVSLCYCWHLFSSFYVIFSVFESHFASLCSWLINFSSPWRSVLTYKCHCTFTTQSFFFIFKGGHLQWHIWFIWLSVFLAYF